MYIALVFFYRNSVNIEIIKIELGQEIQTLQWKLNTLEQNFEIQSATLQEEKLKSLTLVKLTMIENLK